MASEKQQDWLARASSSHDAFMSQFEPLVGHLQSELALTKKMQDQLEASSSSTKRPSHATSMEEMVAVGDDGDTEPTSNPEEPDEPVREFGSGIEGVQAHLGAIQKELIAM